MFDNEHLIENSSALKIEKTFEEVISCRNILDVEKALAQVMLAQQTPAFHEQVVDIYRVSNVIQKTDILNAILSSLGKERMLSADNGSMKIYINENSVVFTEAHALQVIPAQVGKIVQEVEKSNPALIEALCKIYAQSFMLMNALGLNAVVKLTEKLK